MEIKRSKILSEHVPVEFRHAGKIIEAMWVAKPSSKRGYVDIMPFEFGSSSIFTIPRGRFDVALTGVPIEIDCL